MMRDFTYPLGIFPLSLSLSLFTRVCCEEGNMAEKTETAEVFLPPASSSSKDKKEEDVTVLSFFKEKGERIMGCTVMTGNKVCRTSIQLPKNSKAGICAVIGSVTPYEP